MLQANSAAVDTSAAYLDPNTVYCHTQPYLASYLKFAKARDMQGLNMMVETGECGFTPDKIKVMVPTYQLEKIDTTSVLQFEWKKKTIWTFEKLLRH